MLRFDWLGMCYVCDCGKYILILEKDDFVILINNYVIVNDIEVKGVRIDFFYNCCVGNEM